MLARRFLWVVAIIAMLVIASAFVYRLFGQQIMQVAMVPTVPFEESPEDTGPDYTQIANWLARPEIELHPGLWTPEGYQPAPKPGAVVFYVAPTAYLSRDRWNAPLHDPKDEGTNNRLAIFLRGQASVFNGVASIYAPRYRQATFGAFLTSKQDALRALDLAYSDVSTPSSRRFPPTVRSFLPATAKVRSTCCGCSRKRSPANRSPIASSQPMSSDGRCRRPQTSLRSGFRSARVATRQAACSHGRASPSRRTHRQSSRCSMRPLG